jgi:hypothetical protein
MSARRLLVALLAASFLAGIVYTAVRGSRAGLNAQQTATLLRTRLRTPDRFRCKEPSGVPNPGEPSWSYVCSDVTHPARQGYFVKTSGDRITDLQPNG